MSTINKITKVIINMSIYLMYNLQIASSVEIKTHLQFDNFVV